MKSFPKEILKYYFIESPTTIQKIFESGFYTK